MYLTYLINKKKYILRELLYADNIIVVNKINSNVCNEFKIQCIPL